MASRYEVEVTITSAEDLKNVNGRHRPLMPYAVVWVDPKAKCSTEVDDSGDTCPFWDETLVIPLNNYSIEDSTLRVDIVNAVAPEEDTKSLIGSARLPIREVLNEAGFGRSVSRKLNLRGPSGRPHGKLELEVSVRKPRYRTPDPYYAPPYGVPPPAGSRYYSAPPKYGYPQGQYHAARPSEYPYGAPAPPYGQPAVYGQTSYGYTKQKKSRFGGMGTGLAVDAVAGVLGQRASYGQTSYGQTSYGYTKQTKSRFGGMGTGLALDAVAGVLGQPAAYGQTSYGYTEQKKSKFGGMGTGLAVGAVAGVLGGLALAEGADYIEDNITDDVAENVEDDLDYDDDGEF